jgi:RNA polymerase sigma-70 factor (family 1)
LLEPIIVASVQIKFSLMSTVISHFSDDSTLLAHVFEGSKLAFSILYERYWDKAYSAAYKRLKDEDQAKDIVQEIFVSIWLKKDDVISNFPAYLNIAVRNRVFKLAERQKTSSSFFSWIENRPELYDQADSKLLYEEFYAAYESFLKSLSPKRQMIFRLRYHEDLSTKAIAVQMGISRKTVQNQLGKAVDQLRIDLLPILILISILKK